MNFNQKSRLTRKTFLLITRVFGLFHCPAPTKAGLNLHLVIVTESLTNSQKKSVYSAKQSFSFFEQLFRNATSYSGIVFSSLSNFFKLIFQASLGQFVFNKTGANYTPFTFPQKIWPVTNRALFTLSLPLLLFCSGCSTLQIDNVDAITGKTRRLPVPTPSTIPPKSLKDVSIRGGSAVEPIFRNSVRNLVLNAPFTLTFVETPADSILRRISYYSDVEYILPDDALLNTLISIDTTIRTSDDIYTTIEALASASGFSVNWVGRKAIFSESDADALNPAQGYMIVPNAMTEEMITLIAARFLTQCINEAGFSICTGDKTSIRSTSEFVKVVDTQRAKVPFIVLNSKKPVIEIVKGMGLTENEILATKLDNNQWLLSASDDRYLNLVQDVLRKSQSGECVLVEYKPSNITSGDLATALNLSPLDSCSPAYVVQDSVYFDVQGDNENRALGLASRMDAPKPLARLFFMILNETDARNFQSEISGYKGQIPIDEFFESLQLIANYDRSGGWRKIEMVTDGSASASVQQSDRVQGDTTVTDGGTSIQSIDERTVGLTIDVDGTVTRNGFRGGVRISDSNLENDVTISANCSGHINLEVNSLMKVCDYERFSNLRNIRLFGIDRSKRSENFIVFVAVLDHEISNFEDFKVVTSPEVIDYQSIKKLTKDAF